MRNDTREKFSAYMQQVASLNGVASASVPFSVAPSVQQKLEQRMQESSAFLSAINMVGVDAQEGQKIGVGVNGPIAGRTNTKQKARKPRNPTDLKDNKYRCERTHFDSTQEYAQLDAWAHRPEFQAIVRDAILKRQALDRLMIGFNGVRVADETDIEKFPLLEDVNIGWLQKYRDNAPQRVLAHGKEAGKITVGKGGDYANLDALVSDAVEELVDPWHQEDDTLVAVVGRQMLHDKYFPMLQKYSGPRDAEALDMIMSQKRIGGLPAVRAPYMIKGGIFITSLKNLSIYWQIAGRRRTVIDRADWERIDNLESSNDAYVVEDYGRGCLVENIVILPEAS